MKSNTLAWNPLEAFVFTVANEDYKYVALFAVVPVFGSVGNRLDFHDQSSVWPSQSTIDC